MAHTLILYGTTEGQTRRISTVIGQRVRARGHSATLVSSTSVPESPFAKDVDGVIIGASVHAGRHQKSVVEFVTTHRRELEERRSAFFSVSLAVLDDPGTSEAQAYVRAFLDETGWSPDLVSTFAGALRYTKYGFLKRFIMKQISRRSGRPTDTTRDFEFTDWTQVDRFVDRYLKTLKGSEQTASLSTNTSAPSWP